MNTIRSSAASTPATSLAHFHYRHLAIRTFGLGWVGTGVYCFLCWLVTAHLNRLTYRLGHIDQPLLALGEIFNFEYWLVTVVLPVAMLTGLAQVFGIWAGVALCRRGRRRLGLFGLAFNLLPALLFLVFLVYLFHRK